MCRHVQIHEAHCVDVLNDNTVEQLRTQPGGEKAVMEFAFNCEHAN